MMHWKAFGLPALCLALSLAQAQTGGDLQAQILYAFDVEDVNQLSTLIQTLSTQERSGGADDSLRYHLAHAQYRLGLLGGEKRKQSAAESFERCIDELKNTLAQNGADVEALALQGACYARLARLEKLEAVFLRARGEERLAAAHRAAPRNPRVLMLEALQELVRGKPSSAEREKGFAQLKVAAQIFEQTPATAIDTPGWGHAEAYLELGRELQQRGDTLGARNWLEKALISAPDFKAAQRQFAVLNTHSR